MVTGKMRALFLCRIVCFQILALLLFGLIHPTNAAEALEPQTLPQAQAILERLEQQIDSAQKATAQELKSFKQELALVRSFALDCVQQAAPKIERLNNELSVLQPQEPGKTQTKATEGAQVVAPPNEPISPPLARQLQDLQNRKSSLEERVAMRW